MNVRIDEIDVDEARSAPVRGVRDSSDQLAMTDFADHPHDLIRLNVRAKRDRQLRQTLRRVHAGILAHVGTTCR
jgi:hypothetical protein